MPLDYLGQGPDDMGDDRLREFVFELRDVVEAEFDSLTSEGDRGAYEISLSQLDHFSRATKARGLDVPPGN